MVRPSFSSVSILNSSSELCPKCAGLPVLCTGTYSRYKVLDKTFGIFIGSGFSSFLEQQQKKDEGEKDWERLTHARRLDAQSGALGQLPVPYSSRLWMVGHVGRGKWIPFFANYHHIIRGREVWTIFSSTLNNPFLTFCLTSAVKWERSGLSIWLSVCRPGYISC